MAQGAGHIGLGSLSTPEASAPHGRSGGSDTWTQTTGWPAAVPASKASGRSQRSSLPNRTVTRSPRRRVSEGCAGPDVSGCPATNCRLRASPLVPRSATVAVPLRPWRITPALQLAPDAAPGAWLGTAGLCSRSALIQRSAVGPGCELALPDRSPHGPRSACGQSTRTGRLRRSSNPSIDWRARRGNGPPDRAGSAGDRGNRRRSGPGRTPPGLLHGRSG